MTSWTRRGWRVIGHTADTGLEIQGESLPQLFERAADALFAQIVEAAPALCRQAEDLSVVGEDWPDLMFNWLRELLYLWTGKERLVTGVRIQKLSACSIQAQVYWVPYDPAVHRLHEEVKAVTYHQLRVEPTKTGWAARVYLDV
ncbi:MAG: archease [Desulfobacterales bacterium]